MASGWSLPALDSSVSTLLISGLRVLDFNFERPLVIVAFMEKVTSEQIRGGWGVSLVWYLRQEPSRLRTQGCPQVGGSHQRKFEGMAEQRKTPRHGLGMWE